MSASMRVDGRGPDGRAPRRSSRRRPRTRSPKKKKHSPVRRIVSALISLAHRGCDLHLRDPALRGLLRRVGHGHDAHADRVHVAAPGDGLQPVHVLARQHGGVAGPAARQAAVVTQTTTSVANTIPAGGAVAVGLTYSILSSWGSRRPGHHPVHRRHRRVERPHEARAAGQSRSPCWPSPARRRRPSSWPR